MARRLFNGRKFSEDGWPYVDEGSCTWVVVPGTNPPVHLQIQNGPPLSLLRAWAADWNAYVEPLRDADSACWTPGNRVATSNHPGGTAIDLNWDSHDFEVRGTLNAAQMAVMAEMEDFYEKNVFWAGRWKSPVDEMHSQCGYDTYDQQNDRPFPKVLDFIARKIRPDGFSTFRRGGAPGIPAQPPVVEPAQPALAIGILSRATGVTAAKAQEILVGVVNGLRDSQCTNVNRIAMWLAQIGHESAGFNATEEYENGDESTDRWKYKGRTWIQITWRSNYAGLSQWAFGKGLIPTATYFVDNPKKLAEIQYAGLGPAWYWTVARPQINGLCDKRDLVAVTQAINGGQNGATDRKRRYDLALSLGDQLLTLTTTAPPTQGEGFLMALSDSEQREVLDYLRWLAAPGTGEFRKKFESRSAVREPGEGPVDTITGMELNSDGNIDFLATYLRAQLKYTPAVDRLKRVAAGLEPERPGLDALLAQAMLAESAKKPVQTVVATSAATPPPLVYGPGPVQMADTRELDAAYAEIARLRDENARLRSVADNPPYVPPVSTEVAVTEKTPGQIAGGVVDSVTDYTKHLLAMDAADRQGHLAALKALQPSNGDQS